MSVFFAVFINFQLYYVTSYRLHDFLILGTIDRIIF